MKVVLLARGIGSRISEEGVYRPKPMVEIGGMPILWRIMKSDPRLVPPFAKPAPFADE